jgi:hypothetical protein
MIVEATWHQQHTPVTHISVRCFDVPWCNVRITEKFCLCCGGAGEGWGRGASGPAVEDGKQQRSASLWLTHGCAHAYHCLPLQRAQVLQYGTHPVPAYSTAACVRGDVKRTQGLRVPHDRSTGVHSQRWRS